jgi:hypothetical protein
MRNEVNTDVDSISVRVLDDAYLAWWNAESESEAALRAWWRSSGSDRPDAYAAYRAALDREETAALDLERLWSLAELSPKSVSVACQPGVSERRGRTL